MKSLVLAPDEILARPCANVRGIEHELDVASVVADMIEVMRSEHGVGIAAPQIGVSRRIVVMDVSGGNDPERLIVMIDPEITSASTETEVAIEGCLSIPGKFFRVKRHVEATVSYYDIKGKLVEKAMKGFDARVLQHEIAHLWGTLISDVGERVSILDRSK